MRSKHLLMNGTKPTSLSLGSAINNQFAYLATPNFLFVRNLQLSQNVGCIRRWVPVLVGLAQRAVLQGDPVRDAPAGMLLLIAEAQVVSLAHGALAAHRSSGIAQDDRLDLAPEEPAVQAGC